jgi:hypothetical protein
MPKLIDMVRNLSNRCYPKTLGYLPFHRKQDLIH